jgi:FMN-dependent NADH-azoreductase
VKQILIIEVSPRGTASASRAVADTLAARLVARYPSAKLIRRDLAAEQLSHLDGTTLRAITTKDPAELAAVVRSNLDARFALAR